MHRVDPIYLEHQLKRWMRQDAHRLVRPDWRRFVRPEFQADHPFALYERKYSAEQPRVPAGSREGGRMGHLRVRQLIQAVPALQRIYSGCNLRRMTVPCLPNGLFDWEAKISDHSERRSQS